MLQNDIGVPEDTDTLEALVDFAVLSMGQLLPQGRTLGSPGYNVLLAFVLVDPRFSVVPSNVVGQRLLGAGSELAEVAVEGVGGGHCRLGHVSPVAILPPSRPWQDSHMLSLALVH